MNCFNNICKIRKIYIFDDNNIKLQGGSYGNIGNGCTTNKKGWKNMWYGIKYINDIIENKWFQFHGILYLHLGIKVKFN